MNQLERKPEWKPDFKLDAVCNQLWRTCLLVHNGSPPVEISEYHAFYVRFVRGNATSKDIQKVINMIDRNQELDDLMLDAIKKYYN